MLPSDYRQAMMPELGVAGSGGGLLYTVLVAIGGAVIPGAELGRSRKRRDHRDNLCRKGNFSPRFWFIPSRVR
jgi:hypothetical protein